MITHEKCVAASVSAETLLSTHIFFYFFFAVVWDVNFLAAPNHQQHIGFEGCRCELG